VRTERRNIQELINRYRLEPAIRDVFVEGMSDVIVIKRFLRHQRLSDVRVYEIATVDIPPASLASSGLHEGNRGRVIFLAIAFEKSLPCGSKASTCVADRDYDFVLSRVYTSPFLLLVDYCCIEMYAFDANSLDNLLESLAPGLGKTGEGLIAELSPLLHPLFAIRATNIALAMNLRWLDSFEDSCILGGDRISFDENDFISRYLSKNARLKAKPDFVRKLSEVRSRMRGDPRLFVRAHDLANVLAWYLRQHSSKSSPLFKKEIIEKLLTASIDYGRLSEYPFFRELAARTGA
jgi:hypothetical protein